MDVYFKNANPGYGKHYTNIRLTYLIAFVKNKEQSLILKNSIQQKCYNNKQTSVKQIK